MSDKLCRELHLKLLIDPPISVGFIRFICPSEVNIEYHCCMCDKCYHKDMAELTLNYGERGNEKVIVNINVAATIQAKYKQRVHLAS